jgi:transposase
VAVRKRNVSDAESHAPADLASYEQGPHKVRVFVSEADTPGARYVCCWSEARAEEERQIRDARLAKGQAALQKLADQVAAGRLKCATKIAARAATALQRTQARSYFRTEVGDGRFEFGVNDRQLAKEQRLEGRYFLLTNAAKLTAPEAVEAYFTLQEVERAFREMKDFLKLRPIYHWTDRRVQAHIFACVLAYLLERSLSYQLRTAEVDLSARKALDFASRIHAVENTIGDRTLWTLSRPSPQAQQAFKAVGVQQLPSVLAGYQPPDDE